MQINLNQLLLYFNLNLNLDYFFINTLNPKIYYLTLSIDYPTIITVPLWLSLSTYYF